MTGICENCRWWLSRHFYLPETGALGDCRRHAPDVTGNDRGRNRPGWPQTERTDWCGDHQAGNEGAAA